MIRDEEIEKILPDYRRWLYKMANEYAASRPALIDDLVQEGYVAMWRALPKYDPAQGHLPSFLTFCARSRMIDVLRRGTWTGKPEMRGSRSVDEVAHVDEFDDPDVLLGGVGALEGVEIAYHDGEIAAAIDALPEAQRRHVIGRFWLGLDPTSRDPEMVALCALVPEVRQPRLWTGGGPYIETESAPEEEPVEGHEDEDIEVTADATDAYSIANARRALAYARETVAAAERALPDATDDEFEVLLLRIEHPEATLPELAHLAGLTRNAYASRLRRALAPKRKPKREPGARARLAGALAHLSSEGIAA